LEELRHETLETNRAGLDSHRFHDVRQRLRLLEVEIVFVLPAGLFLLLRAAMLHRSRAGNANSSADAAVAAVNFVGAHDGALDDYGRAVVAEQRTRAAVRLGETGN
jgi:hypothetical protein